MKQNPAEQFRLELAWQAAGSITIINSLLGGEQVMGLEQDKRRVFFTSAEKMRQVARAMLAAADMWDEIFKR